MVEIGFTDLEKSGAKSGVAFLVYVHGKILSEMQTGFSLQGISIVPS